MTQQRPGNRFLNRTGAKVVNRHRSDEFRTDSADRQRKSASPWLLAAILLSVALPPASIAATKYEQFTEEAEKAYKNKSYPEAQKAFEQALKEATDKFDKNDKRIGTTTYNLALAFQNEGNYAEAEKCMLKALDLMSQSYGAEHQRVAQVYMDLADLYVDQAGQENKPELKAKAAESYKKGVDIFEKIYAQATGDAEGATKEQPKEGSPKKKGDAGKSSGPQDAALDLSNALRVLADAYAQDEDYVHSEPLYKRSLELEEYGSGETASLARHKSKLAEMYCIQAKYAPAEPLFQEALAISEKVNGADSAETAQILYNFGGMYYDKGDAFAEAEINFKRAIKILSKDPKTPALEIAQKTISLADVLDMQGKSEEAQTLYKSIQDPIEKSNDKGALLGYLKQYQKHLLMQNKKEDAAKIASRIKEIRAQQSSSK